MAFSAVASVAGYLAVICFGFSENSCEGRIVWWSYYGCKGFGEEVVMGYELYHLVARIMSVEE